MKKRVVTLLIFLCMVILSSCGQTKQEETKESLERILARVESVLEEAEKQGKGEKTEVAESEEAKEKAEVAELEEAKEKAEVAESEETEEKAEVAESEETEEKEKVEKTEEKAEVAENEEELATESVSTDVNVVKNVSEIAQNINWKGLYSKVLKEHRKENQWNIKYKLISLEKNDIPQLCIYNQETEIMEIYTIVNDGVVHVSEKEYETSFNDVEMMEYEEILYDLEFSNIVKTKECQIWEEKGFELCWRLINGIDYVLEGMGAALYFGDGGYEYSLKELNGDGIPEIIVAGNIYGFNGSEYVYMGYSDYTLRSFNENTGECTMLCGVSVTDDYAVGCFEGTKFVPKLEFGKVYGDYDGAEDTYWQRVDGIEESIDQHRFEELLAQYTNNGEDNLEKEKLTKESVEQKFGIKLPN